MHFFDYVSFYNYQKLTKLLILKSLKYGLIYIYFLNRFDLNILICTSLDLNTPCAALNRINSLSKAVKFMVLKFILVVQVKEYKKLRLKRNKVFFSNQKRFIFLPNALKYNKRCSIL